MTEAGYARLLANAQVRRLLAGSLVARLPSAMLPLAILLLISARTNSLAEAGFVVAGYGLGRAVISPPVGALVDRFGQARVLTAGAVAQAGLLTLLVLAVELAPAPLAVTMVAVASGAATPPVQASLRALWPVVTSSQSERESAYAFDATSQEMIWIAGPLLVAVLLGLVSPAATVIICALLGCAGTVVFITAPASLAWRGTRRAGNRWHGAFASSNLRTMTGVGTFTGFSWGALTFGLAAFAVSLGSSRSAGLLLACVSLGSITGGLAYGSHAWRPSVLTRLRTLLALNLALEVPLLFVRAVVAAIPMCVVAGLPLAPIYGAMYVLTGRAAPEGTTTEAFTWTSSAFALGVSLGTGVAAALSQAVDVHMAFAVACAGSAVGWLITQALPATDALARQ